MSGDYVALSEGSHLPEGSPSPEGSESFLDRAQRSVLEMLHKAWTKAVDIVSSVYDASTSLPPAHRDYLMFFMAPEFILLLLVACLTDLGAGSCVPEIVFDLDAIAATLAAVAALQFSMVVAIWQSLIIWMRLGKGLSPLVVEASRGVISGVRAVYCDPRLWADPLIIWLFISPFLGIATHSLPNYFVIPSTIAIKTPGPGDMVSSYQASVSGGNFLVPHSTTGQAGLPVQPPPGVLSLPSLVAETVGMWKSQLPQCSPMKYRCLCIPSIIAVFLFLYTLSVITWTAGYSVHRNGGCKVRDFRSLGWYAALPVGEIYDEMKATAALHSNDNTSLWMSRLLVVLRARQDHTALQIGMLPETKEPAAPLPDIANAYSEGHAVDEELALAADNLVIRLPLNLSVALLWWLFYGDPYIIAAIGIYIVCVEIYMWGWVYGRLPKPPAPLPEEEAAVAARHKMAIAVDRAHQELQDLEAQLESKRRELAKLQRKLDRLDQDAPWVVAPRGEEEALEGDAQVDRLESGEGGEGVGGVEVSPKVATGREEQVPGKASQGDQRAVPVVAGGEGDVSEEVKGTPGDIRVVVEQSVGGGEPASKLPIDATSEAQSQGKHPPAGALAHDEQV